MMVPPVWRVGVRRWIHSRHDPLRIAFFGSDHFSVESLSKLKRFKDENPHVVDKLTVITRSIKPKGRYLKNLQELPVGQWACANEVSIERADSSEDIMRLTSVSLDMFNLAIAVSYGKLIPSQFISQCKYGGLNVHPSLLPRYSGSSPIQYALLNDDKETGVTVQTLHPTKFDHGSIVAQSSAVEITDSDNYESLAIKLGRKGADLLVDVVSKGAFLNTRPLVNAYQRTLAPKISKSKSQALWQELSARQVKRVYDALGAVFTFLNVTVYRKGERVNEKQRILLRDVTELIETSVQGNLDDLSQSGDFKLLGDGLCIKAKDGYVIARRVQPQTKPDGSAEAFMKWYKKVASESSPRHFVD
ncbi:uncharacterized protein LODBEIA_P51560 [Lodderomyces beijingensis]|uniref:methionyl-tRNA formyltransferase n=1 Tax=Lodderomyces beijingensis TaxID=1775926 RepID=A0ABP0ZS29_9ASCO